MSAQERYVAQAERPSTASLRRAKARVRAEQREADGLTQRQLIAVARAALALLDCVDNITPAQWAAGLQKEPREHLRAVLGPVLHLVGL